jgi:N-acetylglucosamine-6-phosphate deacetylase
MEKLLLKGKNIFTGSSVIDSGYIYFSKGVIKSVGTDSELNTLDLTDVKVIDIIDQYTIIPGMIDMHIHGAGGADVMDGTTEALDQIVCTVPREGTTSFLATTLTERDEFIQAALQNAGEYINSQLPGRAEVLGIHLEGPFISQEKPGAHSVEHIVNPDINKFIEFQKIAQNHILQVTMAPEISGGIEFARYLSSNGVIASIGHSNAAADIMKKAVEAGVRQVTHLFNAMSPIYHREPGVAGSALLNEKLLCEVIVDGIHLHPEIVNMIYRLKGKEGMVLVTDAIRAKCLGDGTYSFGNQTITVQNGRACLENGTLAGSTLTMNESIKNTMMYTGCPLEDIIQMTAINPAKQLNLFQRKGSIEAGKDADLVILDEKMAVVMTFCRGKLAFHSAKPTDVKHKYSI